MNEMQQQNNLPDQLIMNEILTRLPVKSLCRFKSVSKVWKEVIMSKHFANAHLHKQQELGAISRVFFKYRHKSWLLNYEAYDDENSNTSSAQECYDDPEGLLSSGVELSSYLNVEADPFGSSCGLVCLLDPDSQLYLSNPSLRQWRVIPNPDKFDSVYLIFRGFGYASSIDDFKIAIGTRNGMIYVFSMRSNNWRVIEGGDQFDIITKSHVYYKGILVNERLHWWITPTGSTDDGRIFAFDLVHEVFEEIPIPEAISSKMHMFRTSKYSGISTMGGCLCLSIFWKKNMVEIWMLKKYGDRNSWVRLYELCVPKCYRYNCAEFFGFTKTGKILTRCWSTLPDGRFLSDVIFLIDPYQPYPKLTTIWFDGGRPISSIETCVESLVSPFALATLAQTPSTM